MIKQQKPFSFKTTIRRTALLSSLLILTACSTIGPPPASQDPLVATSWPYTQEDSTLNAVLAAELPWWEFIRDKELQNVISSSLRNNRDLHLAILRIEEARAIYNIQSAEQWSDVNIDGQGGRRGTPGDLNMSSSRVSSGEYGLSVGLSSWEIDLWGRISSLKEAALEEFLATEFARHAVQASLIAEVGGAYLSLLELNERIQIAKQTIQSRQEGYRIFKRRYEVGSSSLLELTQVETLLVQAEALLAQLEQQRGNLSHALTVLVGTPVNLSQQQQLKPAEHMFSPIQVGIPSEVLQKRPDVVSAEHRLRASNANIKAARAAFFPRIGLTSTIGTASAELDGLFDSGSKAWQFIPVISLPIFDGGSRQANLDLAQVRSHMAVSEYEKTIQNAFREVADALNDRHWLTEQVDLGQRIVSIQQRRAYLANLRYDSGAVDYLEVLDAQRELLTAQQNLAEAQGKLLISHVNLYAALGGGTELKQELTTHPTPISE